MASESPKHVFHKRLWLCVVIACAAITIYFSLSILAAQQDTRQSIDRLYLQGADASIERTMHQVILQRRDGKVLNVDVSGTATSDQVMEALAAFAAGDEVPIGWKMTEWEIAGGATIKVNTPPRPGESQEKLCERHDAFVAELQARFPPV